MSSLPALLLRVGSTALLLVGAATAVFFLISFVPGDPAAAMLGEGAAPFDVEALRHDLGLDRPIVEQHAAWMRGLARGDLGKSIPVDQALRRTSLAGVSTPHVVLAPAAAILLVVLATNVPGDALVERLAARRSR
jgi:peptide/nickel transport system permease protein